MREYAFGRLWRRGDPLKERRLGVPGVFIERLPCAALEGYTRQRGNYQCSSVPITIPFSYPPLTFTMPE